VATLGCLGNHDYGRLFNDEATAQKVVEIAGRNGIQILRNEKLTIDGLDFFGMEDPWSPRFNSRSDILLREANSNRPAICLCHNPDVCDRNLWGDFRGYVLAGHTHGGQCKPPFLPAPRLPVINRRYTQGFFELDAGRQLYISRGIGYSMQVRFNCRPEITVFTLSEAGPRIGSELAT
jgi:predicted MPP superfamily phosphohydrolase